MRGVVEYGAALVLSSLVALLILRSDRIVRALGRVVDAGEERLLGRRADRPALRPLPGSHRPIELIAHDVRRLRRRYRTLPPRGIAYAKTEGVRRAYDGMLLEACTTLEIVTLIGVLPDGPDLDRERERVERLLDVAGLSSWDADAA